MSAQTRRAQSLTVQVQPSGRSFIAEPGETVLAAGIRQGIALPYGCKDGACGSCKCRLLQGQVRHGPHQDKALSAAEGEQGYILTCCAFPETDLVLESRQVGAAGAPPIRRMPVRVSSMRRAAPDVMVLHLQLPANETDFQFLPGQYVECILRDGTRRSYSMAQRPGAGASMELHIRHMPGGQFTDQVFANMQEKELLRIEGPFGGFYLREDSAKPIVLLASGTGIAPIKAILEHVRHQGGVRPMTLYWGGRRPSDLYLDDWVRAQLPTLPALHYVPVISEPQASDGWVGRTGLVHQAVLADWPDLSAHEVYACGAPAMVDSARRDFCQLASLPTEAFFADAFTSAADRTSRSATSLMEA